MQSKAVWGIVAFLTVVSMIARFGNGEDRTARSRCFAIGTELQARSVAKAADVAGMRARLLKRGGTALDQDRLRRWDLYVDGLDRLGAGLVENFEDPWPPLPYDRWWATQLDLPTLIEAGEACTDQRLAK